MENEEINTYTFELTQKEYEYLFSCLKYERLKNSHLTCPHKVIDQLIEELNMAKKHFTKLNPKK